VCFLAFTLRQILKQRLAKRDFTGSFIELVEGLSRVPAVLVDAGDGHRYLLRDEIPVASMPAVQALKIVPHGGSNGLPDRPPTVVPRILFNRRTSVH